ncbi:hypothetical protein EJ05DRAFT_489725 [Pseudovirgaria hyperparasitica]|uniref:Uncharacterized protein n=1 Tax=Pseudovirgaria hyperparasitica TaxID=470096 RepID=A0A6A6VWE5_9PEZI|nr:uncharacterized protein EJ05DRAFT_489725 [Pseudovirgaria hyperparasitica]KAF2754024.1 hypothetical protein EJ05DRAFT_489725 [Pseudovirgaria hyperparasitica]
MHVSTAKGDGMGKRGNGNGDRACVCGQAGARVDLPADEKVRGCVLSGSWVEEEEEERIRESGYRACVVGGAECREGGLRLRLRLRLRPTRKQGREAFSDGSTGDRHPYPLRDASCEIASKQKRWVITYMAVRHARFLERVSHAYLEHQDRVGGAATSKLAFLVTDALVFVTAGVLLLRWSRARTMLTGKGGVAKRQTENKCIWDDAVLNNID